MPSLFSGPSRFSLNFRETDTLDRYAFVYQWNEEALTEVNSMQNFRISFNTPGSERDHKTSLAVSADSLLTSVDAQMTLPFRETKAVVKYEWTQSSKILKAGLNSNKVNILTFHTALKNQADLGRYGVRAKMSYFAHEIIDWSGTLNVQNEKASLDGKMMGSFHSPLKVGGNARYL